MGMPGSVEDTPWGEVVWKVGGKVFCFSGETAKAVTVKTTLDRQEALVQDPDISVADYVGRYGWITFQIRDADSWPLVEELVQESYDRVVAALPKARRPRGSGPAPDQS
jgi:predicted DNA-binding protein (MmcQ/YjbR family)